MHSAPRHKEADIHIHDAVYEPLRSADEVDKPAIVCRSNLRVGSLPVSCQLGLPCRLPLAFRLHKAQGLCQVYAAVMRP